MNNLTYLANKFGSDKGTKHKEKHSYSYLYDLIFDEFRDLPINFLELGLRYGIQTCAADTEAAKQRGSSPSISMWLSFFSQATITGFDCSDFSSEETDRFDFIQGDMGIKEDIEKLLSLKDHYDIIIDDGSHVSHHQQLCFKVLWDSLPSRGLYVIEDLHWQPKKEKKYYPHTPKTLSFFNEFFNNGAYIQSPVLSQSFMEDLESSVRSFGTFNNNKLIVIRKL